MSSTGDMIDALERLNLQREVQAIVAANTDHIKTLLQSQMFTGKRGDGKRIHNVRTGRGYASDEYAGYKESMNPAPGYGVPDLYLTGSFYRGMVTRVAGDNIETISQDSKADDLLSKYDESIFLLSIESQQTFADVVLLPDLLIVINQQTGMS